MQLIQDRSLPGCVQAEHDHLHAAAWSAFMPPGLITTWKQVPHRDSHPHLPVAK